MKKNEECEIVRDLLPSYLEKLTNEKTNEFIEKHIAECEECKKVLEKMNEKVALDIVQNKKEADYLKKGKKKTNVKKQHNIYYIIYHCFRIYFYLRICNNM